MGASSVGRRADLRKFDSSIRAENIQTWETLNSAQQQKIERVLLPQQHSGQATHPVISGVIYPDTPEHLAEAIASAAHEQWRSLPSGSGSKLDWGGLVKDIDVIVSTARLNRLIEHAVGDLTVTVEAGMRFADLQTVLAQSHQFLAIDPTYPEQATIGGIIATADTGSLRQRYNSVRDMLLGLSFVRADGQAAKAGGRVVKNVAGYDLMKLFTGSYGTLGVITQATFRVYPLPEASQTVVVSGAAEALAQAVTTLLGSVLTPTTVDLLSMSLMEDLAIAQGMGLVVRFQGILPSVQQQSNRVLEIGKTLGLTTVSFLEADETTLWQQLRERMTVARSQETVTCKIGVRPTEAIAFLQQLQTLPISPWLGQIHVGSGLGRLLIEPPTPQPEILQKMRSMCQASHGFLSILQAPVSTKQQMDVWGYTGNALGLMRQLKQQFDPEALLSPGRFVGGI